MIEPHYMINAKPTSENTRRMISHTTGRLVRDPAQRAYKEIALAELRARHWQLRRLAVLRNEVWEPHTFRIAAVVYRFTMRGGRDVDNSIKIAKDCLFSVIGSNDSASKIETLAHGRVGKDKWQGTEIWIYDLTNQRMREEYLQCVSVLTSEAARQW